MVKLIPYESVSLIPSDTLYLFLVSYQCLRPPSIQKYFEAETIPNNKGTRATLTHLDPQFTSES